MPLQQTSGNVTQDAYGGGVAVEPVYIEQIFSTYLYTGNGSSQTITNGIDLSTKGGMVWIKDRTTSGVPHRLFDTVRGGTKSIRSNSTSAENTGDPAITFSTTGFTTSTDVNGEISASGDAFVSWTFRKQPKFFDVVTFTTNSSGNGSFSHSLGSVPGCVIVKQTDNSTGWFVYHRDTGTAAYTRLNTTAAAFDPGASWINVSSTSVSFINGILSASGTYVAYLFAHNAGGFGLTGTDNVISCGSFTTGGTGNATITLGYEPQWVMIKGVGSGTNWLMLDVMRGWSQTNFNDLYANSATNESSISGNFVFPTSTGFNTANNLFDPSSTYIYIAIRRGPMKVPTDGTSVFLPASYTGVTGGATVTTNFPVDMIINQRRNGATAHDVVDRLRGGDYYLSTYTTDAEASSSGLMNFQSNTSVKENDYGGNPANTSCSWMYRRAPSFFDEVCYTGTGSTTAYTHNLGVAPELMIVKSRNDVNDWAVYSSALGNTKYLFLNTTAASATTYPLWASTTPSATTFTTNGTYNFVGGSGVTYVAYLFATCAGVSKVFSFTGNGSTQTINCGFAGGARFVLLKASSATGGWYVYDTARGMTTLTDPYLQLNSTAAESATLGSVTTVTTGFAVNESVLAGVNTNGVSYIGLAIA